MSGFQENSLWQGILIFAFEMLFKGYLIRKIYFYLSAWSCLRSYMGFYWKITRDNGVRPFLHSLDVFFVYVTGCYTYIDVTCLTFANQKGIHRFWFAYHTFYHVFNVLKVEGKRLDIIYWFI